MSFNDDSQILSQLGILDFHVKSPRRDFAESSTAKDKQQFVDVKLTATVSDTDDDFDSETILDRNNLLPTSKRQNASLIRGRRDNSSIRFLVLSLLFLIAGIVNSSTSLFSCSVRYQVISCLWICLGMFSGSYFAKFVAFRSNIMCFLLISLIILLINLNFPINLVMLFSTVGFFIGNVFYAGFLCWFTFWRKSPRKCLIFLLIFATGNFLAVLSTTNAYKEVSLNMEGEDSPHIQSIRIRRDNQDTEKILLPFYAVNSTTISETEKDEVVVKKPEVATGNVQKTKTKTEENAEKEKEIEEKQKESTNLTNVPTSTSVATTTTTTSTTSTTTSPITVIISPRGSNEKIDANSVTKFPPSCPDASIMLSDSINSLNESSTSLVRIFILLTIFVYTLSFILCCLPCGIRVDSRIKKLESETIVGLGMRLRISIATIHSMIGFLQQLIHFHYSETESQHLVLCSVAFFTTLGIVFIGSRMGSLMYVANSFILLGIGQVFLIASSFSKIGLSFSISGLLLLWVSMFLTVECSLRSRSTVQLAYFLIAWIVGRTIACIFALQDVLMEFQELFTFLTTILIGIMLFYFSRLFTKSKRLKEILDNSSSPIPGGTTMAGTEYISLTAQDVMDDDEVADDDDRSSIELDFELQ